MTFWSGERLRHNLSSIIAEDPDPKQIDCAAYTLHIGPEIYVTPHWEIKDPQSQTIRRLAKGEAFTIPPGQFANILTEEKIKIPFKNIGFISIRASIKINGLVNVSGFHVEPGWNGRLIFSVFNAGPATIHLRRGSPTFLLWIADLDDKASELDAKDGHKPENIPSNLSNLPPNLISRISGTIHSLQSLSIRIDELEKEIRIFITRWKIYGGLLLLIIVILLRGPIADDFGNLLKRAYLIPQDTPSVQIESDKVKK